jgi:hypothetical protein
MKEQTYLCKLDIHEFSINYSLNNIDLSVIVESHVTLALERILICKAAIE